MLSLRLASLSPFFFCLLLLLSLALFHLILCGQIKEKFKKTWIFKKVSRRCWKLIINFLLNSTQMTHCTSPLMIYYIIDMILFYCHFQFAHALMVLALEEGLQNIQYWINKILIVINAIRQPSEFLIFALETWHVNLDLETRFLSDLLLWFQDVNLVGYCYGP